MTPDERDVLEANAGFYAAFESLDLDVMAEVWDRSARASVTHPGWPTLAGWARVATSWDAIFRGTPYIQFFLTDERVHVVGDTAWVTLDENILQSFRELPADQPVDPSLAGSTVAAVNVFVREGGRWLLVHHHGSPVEARRSTPEPPPRV